MRQWRVRLLCCCIYRLHSPHCLENCRISMPLKLQCMCFFCNVCGTTVIELHLQPLFCKLCWLKKGKQSLTVTRTRIKLNCTLLVESPPAIGCGGDARGASMRVNVRQRFLSLPTPCLVSIVYDVTTTPPLPPPTCVRGGRGLSA